MSNFVSASDLNQDIYRGKKHTILAAFWGPGERGGLTRYEAQHLPTALFCDPPIALAGLPGSEVGRNPLPDPHQLQEWFRRWGLSTNSSVVVYDEGRGLMAGRAWWILRWAGMSNVRILNGGLHEWADKDYPIVVGPGNFAAASTAVVNPGQMPVATIDDVRAHLSAGGVLVDAREPNRFAGKKENLDLKAGHIPGAVSVPVRELKNEDGTLRSPAEIRERFAQVGVTSGESVILYSGSGNHSALALAAMEEAGLPGAAHYLGGWSQWSADPANPVERG
ncbi:sulfurtransferase [Corynebacterium alimapuense]|uniref:thiosulfate sulfurtransferase n=1 Tax=Corynebacterium alimapuense TaxID=1576874 RepID=A0A3M8KBJ7_9CORY|nr:sulfurtransferase [Corynebacterium alimapuense]RNE49934.1 sulfurtransferase [Corynebacterium alimapuense]